MSDIFGRADQVYNGGLSSDASWMYWAGMPSGGLGMLITQMQIQYQQPIRRIYEIGPWTSVNGVVGQPVYYIAGRPEGTVQLQRIVGPVAVLGGFYRVYGNVCSFKNSLFFVSGTGCIGGLAANEAVDILGLATTSNPFLGWFMNGVVITGIGLSAQSQEMLINESTSLMFVSLRLFTAEFGVIDGVPFGDWQEV